MDIRDMRIEDMAPLAALYSQFWREESNTAKMREKFTRLRDNEAYILLCAVDGGRLIGSVMGIVCEELYGECEPFLVVENMIVDKSGRKGGVGRALFRALENKAKERGCTQIILVTETERRDACGFYESMGFHPSANKGYKKKLM